MKLHRITDEMTATRTKGDGKGKNYGHSKPLHATYAALCIAEDGTPEDVATLRIWWGSGSRVYASVWLHCCGEHLLGTGSAGGGGYDKPSAAAEFALNSAGFKLSQEIAGRGETAIPSGILAALRAMGETRPVFWLRG